MSGEIVPQNIAHLRRLIGEAVFLPCNQSKGGKGPIVRGWQRITLADMKPAHIAQCERSEFRIGVLLDDQ